MKGIGKLKPKTDFSQTGDQSIVHLPAFPVIILHNERTDLLQTFMRTISYFPLGLPIFMQQCSYVYFSKYRNTYYATAEFKNDLKKQQDYTTKCDVKNLKKKNQQRNGIILF